MINVELLQKICECRKPVHPGHKSCTNYIPHLTKQVSCHPAG